MILINDACRFLLFSLLLLLLLDYCKQHRVRLLRFIAFVGGHPVKQVQWEPGTVLVGKPASWQLSSVNYPNSNEKPMRIYRLLLSPSSSHLPTIKKKEPCNFFIAVFNSIVFFQRVLYLFSHSKALFSRKILF
jgi:hypothetical protein